MTSRFLLIGAAVSALAAGAAFAAAPAAPPAPPQPPRFERAVIDTNNDGFISRAEAQAHAEALFARLDVNNDGKIDAAERTQRREMRIVRRDGDRVTEEVIIERGAGGTEERREIRKQIVKEREDGRRGGRGDRHVRHNHMIMGGPMGMMVFMSSDEADVNGDGALSRQEFVNQHMRFFDAADVNGDGKIKFDPPPAPPAAPAPPAPPR